MTTIPFAVDDPINARILAVSEDSIQGFQADPIGEISRLSGVDRPTVVERLETMLRIGVIRRIRQTLLATNLAHGALIAWKIDAEKLNTAFDWLFTQDPFSGHVVIRSTDAATPGSAYRLWTTLKVPQGYNIHKHCQLLADKTGAESFRIMPAKRLFALGVGHMRRRLLEPGAKTEELAVASEPEIVQLSPLDWQVLMSLKREFLPGELRADTLWQARADEAGVDLDTFYRVARSLNERGVIGRFSTFLEHVKPLKTGERVTRFNGLFHWGVPAGREIEAGRQIGRHYVLTHCYWREGGPEFGNVQIMGVAHGNDKELVLAHKQAIDRHLESVGIPLLYTNVFWGGRSEIKPSEISPVLYAQWCREQGVDPETMRL